MTKRVTIAVMIALILLCCSGGPIATRAPVARAQSSEYFLFLPLIIKNDRLDNSRYYEPCSDDIRRGQLYRDLVTFTNTILYWPERFLASFCCGDGLSARNGEIIGSIAGLAISIVFRIVYLIFTMFVSALGIIGQFLAIATGSIIAPVITCTGDAEYFCVGLAIVMALDSTSAGLVTAVVLFVVAVLTFYLGLYVVSSIRNMMEPGAGGDVTQ